MEPVTRVSGLRGHSNSDKGSKFYVLPKISTPAVESTQPRVLWLPKVLTSDDRAAAA